VLRLCCDCLASLLKVYIDDWLAKLQNDILIPKIRSWHASLRQPTCSQRKMIEAGGGYRSSSAVSAGDGPFDTVENERRKKR